jgi:hypothetical protein
VNVTISDSNCGQCGNACSGFTPTCVAGSCSCTPTGSSRCQGANFCDLAGSKNCTSCPTGFGNCGTTNIAIALDNGQSTDCETSLTTTLNCGACANNCNELGTGHSCTNGQCFCGTTAGKCPWDKPVCDNGQCVECNSATLDPSLDLCRGDTIFDQPKFCNPTTKSCEACPAGRADCNATLDTGVPGDCETNVTISGHSLNCEYKVHSITYDMRTNQ